MGLQRNAVAVYSDLIAIGVADKRIGIDADQSLGANDEARFLQPRGRRRGAGSSPGSGAPPMTYQLPSSASDEAELRRRR